MTWPTRVSDGLIEASEALDRAKKEWKAAAMRRKEPREDWLPHPTEYAVIGVGRG